MTGLFTGNTTYSGGGGAGGISAGTQGGYGGSGGGAAGSVGVAYGLTGRSGTVNTGGGGGGISPVGPNDAAPNNFFTTAVSYAGGCGGSGTVIIRYNVAPTVTSVSPSSGTSAGGTTITITISGTNFVSGATVTVGGVAATSVSVVSATSITATTPAGMSGA